MAAPREQLYRFVENAALPYDKRVSPITSEPYYVDGQNILTSIREYAERRPGWATAFETTPTTFAGDILRFFDWRKWNGDTFILCNEVTGTQSKVYKLKVGTDVSFVLLLTSATTEPFDFVIAANQLFFTNGTDLKKWDGTTLTGWGITAPASAPTLALTGTGITAEEGYKYVYCYGNSTTAHVSSPSPASASTGAFSNQQVDVTGARSTDAQVDKVHIFRTTDGGGGIYFEHPDSPIANPGAGTWTLNDADADTTLDSTIAPAANANNPPPAGLKGIVHFANRIWGFNNDTAYHSNWEEQGDYGVEEESFHINNTWGLPELVTGLGKAGDVLLLFMGGNTQRIIGDALDTFEKLEFLNGIGLINRANMVQVDRALVWLDQAVGVHVSNGVTENEFGNPILADIVAADHNKVSLGYYSDGFRKWLLLVDGSTGANKTYVYDLETNRWMPPWTIGGRAIRSCRTSEAVWDLLLGRSTKKVLKLNRDGTAWNDDTVAYAADCKTNLFPVAKEPAGMGQTGDPEYIVVERNATALSDLLYLSDDAPIQSTFTSIFANVSTPGLRSQGATLFEQWFYARKPLARRVAIQFKWPAADANFALIGFGIASREGQR